MRTLVYRVTRRALIMAPSEDNLAGISFSKYSHVVTSKLFPRNVFPDKNNTMKRFVGIS